MIVSKDIDTIIWRFIHNDKVKSINTEYSCLTSKICDSLGINCDICNHSTFYRNLEYNWRNIYSDKYTLIYDLRRHYTKNIPDNY